MYCKLMKDSTAHENWRNQGRLEVKLLFVVYYTSLKMTARSSSSTTDVYFSYITTKILL